MKAVLIGFILFTAFNLNAQSPSTDPHWSMTRFWNFKTMTLSQLMQDWYINPCVHALDHKGKVEPQYYLPDNVTIDADGLHLTAKQQSYYGKLICYEADNFKLGDGKPNLRWCDYTSGEVETKEPFNKAYGYIEARLKAPYGYNFFPAFWTVVGNTVNGTNASEIDIFEFLPANGYPNSNGIVKTNVHLNYEGDPTRNQDVKLFSDYTQFNTYAVEWTPSRITWYVNNLPVRTLDNPGVNDPVKLILNLALNPWNSQPQLTTFPSDMVIEYVKVYDYRKDCSTSINDCSFNFATYDNKVKSSITIGGNNCSNSLSAGDNRILRVSSGILINGDFSVPVGAELYLDANSCY